MSDDRGFPIPPVELLPRLLEWQAVNGSDFSLQTLLCTPGNLDLSIAHANFFWPEFIEVDNYIIFKDRYSPESFKQWIERLNGNLSKVESIINHTHFYDVIANDERQQEQKFEAYEYLAQVARRTWKAALAEQFPDRQFEFHYITEPDDYGPALYFWQVRNVVEGDSQ